MTGDTRKALQHAGQPQRRHRVRVPLEVSRTVELHVDVDRRLVLRSHPQAQLRDHREVRLHDELVPRRAKAMLEQRPGRAVGYRAHAGANHLPVGKHDFHAADVVAVVAEAAEAALQRVADHAAPAVAGNAQLQRNPVLLHVVEQVEEADAGLDDAVAALRIDLDDAVQPAQVEHHRAGHARCRAAVAEILAARNRPQRDPELVGDLQHALDLLHVGRRDRRCRSMTLLAARRVGVEVGAAVLVGFQHPFATHDAGECCHGLGEARRADTRWKNELHAGHPRLRC